MNKKRKDIDSKHIERIIYDLRDLVDLLYKECTDQKICLENKYMCCDCPDKFLCESVTDLFNSIIKFKNIVRDFYD